MQQRSSPGNLVRAIVAGRPSGGGGLLLGRYYYTSIVLDVRASLSPTFLFVGLFVGSFVHMRVFFLPCPEFLQLRSILVLCSSVLYSVSSSVLVSAELLSTTIDRSTILSTGLSRTRGGYYHSLSLLPPTEEEEEAQASPPRRPLFPSISRTRNTTRRQDGQHDSHRASQLDSVKPKRIP